MALSGNSLHWFRSTYHGIYITWSATQSNALNQSYLTMNAYYRLSAGSSVATGAVGNNHFTMDGQNTADFTRNNLNGSGPLDILINSSPQTLTINHNPDGSKSLTISYSINVNATLGGVYYGVVTGSDTITLDPIPRMSVPNAFSAFTITDTTIPITITRYSSDYTHDIALLVNGVSILTRTGVLASTDTAYTITLTAGERTAMYNATPNAMTGTATLALTTKSGATVIGTTQNYVLTNGAIVPSSIVPSFSTVTVSENVTAVSTLALGTKFVQGISKLNLAITSAVAGTGATIASYAITCEQKVISAVSGVSDVLTCAGLTATAGVYTLVVSGKVTDSRGQIVTKTVNVSVYVYTKPKINSFYTKRATDAGGVENALGTFCKFFIDVSVSSLLNGSSVQKNTLTYKLEYSIRNANSYSTAKTATLAIGTIVKQTFECLGTYSVASSYDLKMTITDIFGSTYASVATDTLGTGVVTMAWGDGFISIGKIPTNSGNYNLEVGLKGLISDGVIVATKAVEIVSETSTLPDIGFIRFKRLDGTLSTLLSTGVGGSGLNLHTYNSSGAWSGLMTINGNGQKVNGQRRVVYNDGAVNANDIIEEWMLAGAGSGSTNFPISSEWWYIETIQYNDVTRHQTAYSYARSEMWIRKSDTYVWTPWAKVSTNADGIYEQGSNANGWYTKFTSGIMICSQTGTIGANCSLLWNKWYITNGNYQWTYPAGFTRVVTSFSGSISGGDLCAIVPEVMNTGLSCYYRMARGDTMATVTKDISVTAIGYWK